MFELIDKYEVIKLSFHPISLFTLQLLHTFQSLRKLVLLLPSQMPFGNIEIKLPPNLQGLTLGYYDQSLHQSLLTIPENLVYLSLECAKIQNYEKFAKLVKNSNVLELKITSSIVNFKEFFSHIGFKKFSKLSISQSSFFFIEYWQLKPMLEYFS